MINGIYLAICPYFDVSKGKHHGVGKRYTTDLTRKEAFICRLAESSNIQIEISNKLERYFKSKQKLKATYVLQFSRVYVSMPKYDMIVVSM